MSDSDKKIGVTALTLFDLRRRCKVGKLSMVGTSGTKFPAIRMPLDQSPSRARLSVHRRTPPEEYLIGLQ